MSTMSAFEKTQKQHERRQIREKQIQQMEMAIAESGRNLDKSFASLNAEIDGFADASRSSSFSSRDRDSSRDGANVKVEKSKEDWSAPALGATRTAREFLRESSSSKGVGGAHESSDARRRRIYEAGSKHMQNIQAGGGGHEAPNLKGVSLYGSSIAPADSNKGHGSAAKGAIFGTAFGWVKGKLGGGGGGKDTGGEHDFNLAPRGDAGHSSFNSVELRPRGYDESGRAPPGGAGYGVSKPESGRGGSGRNLMGRMASRGTLAMDTLAMCMSKRCACVFALLLVVGVIVGVTTSGKAGMINASTVGASISAQSEEDAATRSGVNLPLSEKFDVLKSRIVELEISDPATLVDGPADPEDPDGPKHPQYLALKWLAEDESNSHLDPRDSYALQRYALAVFYRATFDAAAREDEFDPPPNPDREEWDNWDVKENWMTSTGICQWYGVQCHHRSGTSSMDTTYDDDGMVTFLKLPKNEIRGPLPKELFTALTDLRVVDLRENGLNGTIPTEIGLARKLQYLQMAGNYLEGNIPQELGECKELEQLHFSDNWLEGTIPEGITKLSLLRGLGLFHNYLNGTVPFSIGELSDLKNLYLDENYLTGTIPASLVLLHKAADVRLANNELKGTIPTELADLPFLEILYLQGNELTGTIPTELAQLGHLDELYLYKNKITGTLPTEFGNMADLDHLYLDHCELSGTIPTEYGRMENLQHFFIYSNHIGGSIPTQMGNMNDLVKVNFGENDITGVLPTQLGNLEKIEELALEDNYLMGAVPVEMGQLHKMDKLTLHGNSITGTVPPEVCDLTRSYSLEEFSMDCAAPTEGGQIEVSCDCCTECMSTK